MVRNNSTNNDTNMKKEYCSPKVNAVRVGFTPMMIDTSSDPYRQGEDVLVKEEPIVDEEGNVNIWD